MEIEDSEKYLMGFEEGDNITITSDFIDHIENILKDRKSLKNKYMHEKIAKEEVEELLENSVSKDTIKEIFEKIKISDIEPLSIYKVPGDVLFNLQKLLEGGTIKCKT